MALLSTVATQLTTPLTSAQRPMAMWIGGVDRIASIDVNSYRLDDAGGSAARLSFTIEDKTNVIGPTIHVQDRVIWQEFAADRLLFQGFVKDIKLAPHAVSSSWAITCADISEVLDFSPVIGVVRPAEGDAVRIGAILASVPGISSQSLSALASLPATTYSQTTARGAIAEVLGASVQADYYVDHFGGITTYAGTAGPSAPFDINNDAPNGTTTIAAMAMTPEQDGFEDVDFVYVMGATQAGTGLVGGGVPRDPPRVAVISSSTSTDAGSLAAVGAAELFRRQNLFRVGVTVAGKDGWKRGQVIDITDARIGWTARSFVIQGVSMTVRKTTQSSMSYAFRQYELTCGGYMPRFSSEVRLAGQLTSLVGPIGGR